MQIEIRLTKKWKIGVQIASCVDIDRLAQYLNHGAFLGPWPNKSGHLRLRARRASGYIRGSLLAQGSKYLLYAFCRCMYGIGL